ncbi:MAG: hypothetical protein PBV54_15375 [Achromobacter xylosoxidans]
MPARKSPRTRSTAMPMSMRCKWTSSVFTLQIDTQVSTPPTSSASNRYVRTR